MKSKYLFLAALVIGCLTSVKSYAQESSSDTKNYTNELSISVDNIFAKSTEIYQIYEEPIVEQASQNSYNYPALMGNIPQVGLGYKLNLKNSALRFKISFGNTHQHSSDSSVGDFYALTTQVKVGYEFHKTIRKVQMFFGLDLLVSYDNMKNVYMEEYYSNNGYTSLDYTAISNSLGYGASPFFGVNYFLMPNLSISTELNFTVELYQSYVKSGFSGHPQIKTDENSFNTHIGPLGNIGINLYF